MKKRVIFIIFFIVFASGISVFIANEYIKRVEKNAIETYMQSIQDELKGYSINMTASNVECEGFIKHTCKINNVRIYNNIEINLNDISLSIKDLSYDNIGVLINIGQISHNQWDPHLSILPSNFQYNLNLHKVDSNLGYVMLKRSVYFDFESFEVNAGLNLLLRESKFKNKSIFYLLKEWFDNTTPSFFEYSIDNISIKLKSKDNRHKSSKLENIINMLTNDIDKNQLSSNELALKYFDELIANSHKMIDKTISEITMEITRKNKDISFFNLLDKEAAVKKSLEIIEVINSINETYDINIATK